MLIHLLAAVALVFSPVAAEEEESATEKREREKAERAAAKEAENEAKEHAKECKDKLRKSKSEGEMAGAVQDLASVEHEVICKELMKLLAFPVPKVRQEAALSLKAYPKDPTVASMLLSLAKREKDPIVQGIFLEVVGCLGVRQLGAKLVAFIEERDSNVALKAIQACGDLKSGQTVDALIKYAVKMDRIQQTNSGYGMPKIGPQVQGEKIQDTEYERKTKLLRPLLDALRDVTGQSFATAKEWDSWWKKNKRTWRELPDPDAEAEDEK